MNLKDKRTRRLCAASASAAVIVAGGVVVTQFASAATSLTISGSTSVTTLDFGSKVTGTLNEATANSTAGTGVLADNFEASTYAYHVGSLMSSTASKLGLVLDSYTAPTTITSGQQTAATSAAALVYGQVTAGVATAPNNTWKKVSVANTATTYFLTDPVASADTQDTYVTATEPGTYKFHFVDTGASLSPDDDGTSPTITVTVLDAFKATTGAAADTTDDWAPGVSVNSPALKLGAPLTASVSLTDLTTGDARGATSGVNYLASKLKAVVGFAFVGSTAGLDTNLGNATKRLTTGNTSGSTAMTSATLFANPPGAQYDYVFGAGVAAGTYVATRTDSSNIVLSTATTANATTATFLTYSNSGNVATNSAVTSSIAANTLTNAGTVTASAAIDQTGAATFNGNTSTPLATVPAAAYTDSGVTGWTWAPKAASGIVKIPVASSNAVSVKTGTAKVTYSATVTAGTPVAGQVVYFTTAPGLTTDSVTADGTLVSSNTISGQKVYSVLTDASGIASIGVTSSATSTGKTYTVKASLNGVAATSAVGTALVSSGNTTVTYGVSTPAQVSDKSDSESLYPAAGTASVTLKGQILDQFGVVSQPDATYSQNVQVTVGGVVANVTPVNGAFSYTYTPTTAPTAGSTTAVSYSYTDASVNGGTALTGTATIRWVPVTLAGVVTLTTPANGATGVTVASGSAAPSGQAISGAVADAGGAAIPFKLVTLSGSDGVLFANTSTGSNGMSKTLKVGADASGNLAAYAFYTKAGTATVTATADSKTVTNTVTTADGTDPYTVLIKGATVLPGGSVTVSGTVTDAFGNPVPTEYVALSLDSTPLGSLSSSNPQTNSGGVFNTTFTTADLTTEGKVNITAKLRSTLNSAGAAVMTANPTAASGWATGGLTIPAGAYTNVASISVAKAQATTIEAPSSAVRGQAVTLKGLAVAGSTVDIYAMTGSSAFGWVGSATADAVGAWTWESAAISAQTSFIAKTTGSTSAPVTVKVTAAPKPHARVSISAKAAGKGRVQVTINGTPKKAAPVVVYVKVGSHWVKLVGSKTNSQGHRVLVVKTGKGSKMLKVTYSPAGAVATYRTFTIRVK